MMIGMPYSDLLSKVSSLEKERDKLRAEVERLRDDLRETLFVSAQLRDHLDVSNGYQRNETRRKIEAWDRLFNAHKGLMEHAKPIKRMQFERDQERLRGDAEPVGIYDSGQGVRWYKKPPQGTPLYTHPAPKPEQPGGE